MSTKANTTLPTISQVRQALKGWHSTNGAESPLATLYIYRQLQRELGRTPRHTANQLLLTVLAQMRQRRLPEADFLQRRFLDDASIGQLAQHYSVAESTIYTMQREAVERATETVRELEIQARAAQRERLWRRLGAPTYGELVGVQSHVEHLLSRLREVQPPWIVAIEGLGGIGKTALADALLRQIIGQDVYDEIGWVSAQQHRLNLGGAINTVPQPALTADSLVDALVQQLLPDLGRTTAQRGETLLPRLCALLKQVPHLIVIDNLESLLDVESLLPTLQELANPTKFLLTSRDALYTTLNIYHFKVPELDEAHALQLVRQEAQISNLPTLATAPDSALQPIYTTVGGNPLALRLIVGQTHIYTLASILDHLRKAQGQTAENLYTYIYRRAWDGLDALNQDVLLIMPLVNPQGDDVDTIAAVGGLEVDVVRHALNRLVTFNLVDVHGSTINERRYRIHGLTRTFLHEQVLHWKG